MSQPFDIPWMIVPHTGERVLEHRDTGQVIEFSDDPEDTSMDLPIVGLASMYAPEDIRRLRAEYTDYELASGGA